MSEDIIKGDLTKEEWREYEWGHANVRTTYRIVGPATLFMRKGGTTHRVLDKSGIVHLIPSPGQQGCVLRWKPIDAADPVQF